MNDETLVDTACGTISGQQQGTVRSWLGVPYATAGRFEVPKPVAGWKGVLRFNSYGAQSPQNMSSSIKQAKLLAPGFDEDCLFLNIWSPANKSPEPLPVLFWIHGGAFIGGGSNLFDGSEYAAEHNIVVVSINYRLGVFGWTNFGAVLGNEAFPSNLGFRDQIAALTWVHENIRQFGGDPDKITISGESAGSASVAMLMLHKPAWPMFRGAIMQSGSYSLLLARETSERLARRLLEILGIDSANAARLKSLSTRELMEAQCSVYEKLDVGLPVSPWWDGDLLPASHLEAQRAPVAPVPLLAGVTRDEIRFFELPMIESPLPMTAAALNSAIERGLGAAALAAIRKAYPNSAAGNRELASDLAFKIPTRNFAERHAAHHSTWFYRFDYEHPIAGACHLLDTAFLWPYRGLLARICRGGPMSGKRKALAQRMKAHWASFVKAQAPGANWPAYTLVDRTMMGFDLKDRLIKDPDKNRREIWALRETVPQF